MRVPLATCIFDIRQECFVEAPPLSKTPEIQGFPFDGGLPRVARIGHGSAQRYAIPVPIASAFGISTMAYMFPSKGIGSVERTLFWPLAVV